ncbi:hypothetical protein [Bdellovibrio sp. HCB288]|uniref:hypothetical protein n=1 Tax=Bdellovibrio sp. HCB288 TaxID=3394355 RepID=UPI0039B514AC
MLAPRSVIYLGTLSLVLALTACGPGNEGLTAIDETGDETASIVDPGTGSVTDEVSNGNNTQSAIPQKLLLNQAMSVRYESNSILENKAELPAGTQIEVPEDYSTKNLDYRDSNGKIVRSSTGFIYPIKVVSVPSSFASQFPQSKIDSLNKTSGGLFIFASIVGSLQGAEGNFAVVVPAAAGEGFLKNYNTTGKPKFSYTTSSTKRFPKINKGVDPATLSSADRAKWNAIYSELRKVANREIQTPKSYLMVDSTTAKAASLDYEKTGKVALNGAWSIAVQQTAVRHGFANVPCAEFQSELVREAYQRAGYRVSDDFNTSKGNKLIWSSTAAVVNFSMALYKAGWIAWDGTKYKPMTGAILMNGSGISPGHTYISGSDDGMIIVDNGSPQGRDLRKTSDSIISMMFETGVFFLPPGINPPTW